MTSITKTLSPTIGVEICGVFGKQFVDRGVADEIAAALDAHGVVVVRDANISDEDLITFSRLLGDLVVVSTGEHRYPEIQTITMDPEKANPLLAVYRKGNFLWHIDGMHDTTPQKTTLLSAIEVAEEGGDTEFATTYAAYDALPEEEKVQLKGLTVVHSFASAQRKTYPEASEKERASWNRQLPREHPLIWNYLNGRHSLLIGSTASHIVGMPADESDALLERLLSWATQPQFVLRHAWRRGDLVLWDNTGLLHRALPFEPKSRRLLHRTTLVGERAVA